MTARAVLALLACWAAAGAGMAAAQTADQGQRPPISVKGWRHDKSPAGLHTFVCAPPACSANSTVVYQILPPSLKLTFEQYRRSAEPLTRELEAREKKGTRIELTGVTDASKTSGSASLRMFKTRQLASMPDGARKFIVSGYIFGSRHTVSITSSAPEEAVADKNFTQFAGGLWLFAEDKLEKPKTAQKAPSLAQAPDANALPPTGIAGWRYEKGAHDVHMFHCAVPQCVAGSRVSYRLYSNEAPVKTLGQFRQEQEQIAKLLEERGGPGTKIQVLGVDGDDKADRPALMRSIRLQTRPDGSREYVHSGLIMGQKLDASLISSSHDENAAKSNYAQFAVAVALYVQVAPTAPGKSK